MEIAIKGGLPQDGESLCQSCRWAHMQKGFRESEEIIFCGYSYQALRPVLFKVADCSDYIDRTTPSLYEMGKMALLINVEPARKQIGFERGIGFRSQVEDDDEEDTGSTME